MVRGVLASRRSINGVLAVGARPNGLILPTTSLVAYWYAGDGQTQPTAISASGDGQPVDSWADALGNSAYTVSNTGTARPTWRQSVSGLNNRGAVEFDGTAQYMSALLSGQTLPIGDGATFLIATVAQSVVGSSGSRTVYGEGHSTTTNRSLWIGQGSAGGRPLRAVHDYDSAGAGTLIVNSPNPGAPIYSDGAKHLGIVYRDGGNTMTVRMDGIAASGSLAFATTTLNSLAIGAWAANTVLQYWEGKIALVAVYSDGSAQLAAIEAAIAAHYGF